MNILVKKLEQHKGHLSQLETTFLNDVIASPELFVKSTIDSISKRLFISTATISRCCKQLGFEGFQQFKYAVAQALENNESETIMDVRTESLTHQVQRIQTEIEKTLARLSEEKLNQATNYLIKSQAIEFFGVGASLPTCMEASRKLTFVGKTSSARGDWDELDIVARNLTKKDLAIIISYSGETPHVLAYAKALKANKVPVLALIGCENSSLEKLSTLTMTAAVTNCYYGEIDMSSRIPFNVLLELLILNYLKASGVER
ncbi:MurR/RpiR family transcriptional regulator [Brochothrix thermosphacta]|uniref:MurR/RpiR family transcriptional regulator n=1 Tax=Brochothrix thermosphacta TaxID=2756 RepID=UPI00083F83D1|nr:MurR/RpiR family transcriptional regulator [Brochothrix thermosphacta]ODJ59956.1 hypothetical protein BFR44_02610 [Brochothrix thermosphacta]